MTKVEVKNYGPAMLLDSDDESALVQLLREGPAQNLRVSIKDLKQTAQAKPLQQATNPA